MRCSDGSPPRHSPASPVAPGRRCSTDGRSACLPRAWRKGPSCGRGRRARRSRWRRQPRAYCGRPRPDVARLVRQTPAFALVSFGQALVVISGGFDLSVGSLVAMSISAIVFFRSIFGIVGGTIAAVAAAAVAGLLSGFVVSRTKIPPFIVTLGMLSIADSMSWIPAAGQPTTVEEFNDSIAALFSSLPLGENMFPIIVLILGFV